MDSLELNDRAHRAGLLDRDVLDEAEEFFALRRVLHIGGRTVLQDANELAGAGDLAARDAERVDQIAPTAGNHALERAGVDDDGLVIVRDMQRGRRRAGRSGTEGERTGGPDRGNGRQAAPLERAVWPIGQRPGLQRQSFSLGIRQAERGIARERPLWPGHAPADPMRQAGSGLAEPVQLHRLSGGSRERASGRCQPAGPRPRVPRIFLRGSS